MNKNFYLTLIELQHPVLSTFFTSVGLIGLAFFLSSSLELEFETTMPDFGFEFLRSATFLDSLLSE
jgi:hypothetical protein